MSVIIRERDRERERDRDRDRDWDDRSSYRDGARGSVTVKQYRIPRDDDLSSRTEKLTIYDRERDRRSSASTVGRDTRGFEETRIIRRERTPELEPERRVERDIRIERIDRDRVSEPDRRWERDVRIERYEPERDPEPRRFERDYQYERDYERLPTRREPYELERYSKSTEYFRPEPPQPIIIRQEPQQIIIQEAPRAPIVIPAPREETDFQLIHRSEVNEDRQVARREPEQEDYYYERRTREVSGKEREDDFVEERYKRRGRDISPGDSISQRGRDYSSDDSMVYIRKETRDSYERDESPHHRRHLVEGVAAGIGAAEILRHHRKKEDKDPGRRVGRDLGAGVLGAVAAEGISRARSRHREKSRSRRGSRERSYSRSRSRDRESRRKHRRDRSRSRSKSRVRQLAGLGLGAAALAAAVSYANRNKNDNKKEDRRSRSRTRRHPTSEAPDDARNPSHRNKKIAQAGLVGATAAGLIERARSKSRSGRGKSRSKSRIRTGLPIAAAGLGSAAIAGIYEKAQANKAEKEEKASRREGRARRRESRSRSRSRSVVHEGSRDLGANNSGLIEYGDQPVYSNAGAPDYYNRPASQTGYYPGVDPAAPAVAAGAGYGATNQLRNRDRSLSSSESDSRRRRRHRRRKSARDESGSRSRTRDIATAGLAAAGAAVAASEHEKRKQRRKEEKRERKRQQEAEQERAYTEDYPQQPQPQQQAYPPMTPPGGVPPAGYPPENYYPSTNSFPPPPNPGYSPGPAGYNPADFAAQPGQHPNAQVHPEYGYPPQPGYTPPTGGPDSPPAADPYAPNGSRTRRGDENVSAESFVNTSPGIPTVSEPRVEEGLNSGPVPNAAPPPAGPVPEVQQRAFSQPPPTGKSVRFNQSSPSSLSGSKPYNKTPTGHHPRGVPVHDPMGTTSAPSVNDRHRPHPQRRRRASDNDINRIPSPTSSDETIDLPDRFDKYGRRKPEKGDDPLADQLEEFLNGNGLAGRFLDRLTGALEGVDGDSGRRRHRRT